jgi:hypothetical protein
MDPFSAAIFFGGMAAFLCSLLARYLAHRKGYRVYPWVLVGGPISALILLLLPDCNTSQFKAELSRARRRRAELLIGIAVLLLMLIGACVAVDLLVPRPLDYEKEPTTAFLLGCARTMPTDVVFLLGLLLSFLSRKRCPKASGIAAAAILILIADHIGMHAVVAWWNSMTASRDLDDRIYVVRMERIIHVITALSYGIWTGAFAMLIVAVFIGRSQMKSHPDDLDNSVPELEKEVPTIESQAQDTRIYRKP